MGKSEETSRIIREILDLLLAGPMTKGDLHQRYIGKSQGACAEAIGALRVLGLMDATGKGKILSLSAAGRYVAAEKNGITPGDMVAAFRRSPGIKGNHHMVKVVGYPTLESLHRSLATLSARDTAKLQGIRKNVQRLRSKTERPDYTFGFAMYMAAIDREFERRAADPYNEEWFRWPDTEAPGGDGSVGGVQFMDEGMLLRMEYRVGVRNGVATPTRRQILRQIFEDVLPPVFPPDYMRKWGDKSTPLRLKTLAYTIAQLAKNLKRKHDGRMDVAIGEYEADLQWLYETFYVGRFGFAWPTTMLD